MRLLPLAAAAVLLAGCGSASSDDGTAAPEPASPSASSAAPPTAPPVDPQVLERHESLVKLAAAAQEQAAQLNAEGASIPPRDGPVLGADISWPQCPPGMGIPYKETSGQPMPTAQAEYVVIGLTNGPGFHANPCLADQVAWAEGRGLLVSAYSVISWPDDAAQQQYGGLQEAGHAQAEFNIASMEAAGLDSPVVWLDVEQVPHYEWSTSTAANAEVVLGAAQGYLDAGYRVGVYSTPAIWSGLVGDLSLGVPEWRAAGQTSRSEAESRCGEDWSIQGGEAVLAQWVEDARDVNVTCPGGEQRLGEFFRKV
ncbi:hypothetical protein G5V58_12905 [Nocardioides anomalus]|uniref:DUF1906 domain-containing protein n=1 Tax=Nocardioides anomalus TaxID=2712223 RepID=A0A6G6WDW6_9ACTN|nr:hypothetical protein [Nocardioides anomalus]QIG43541.1 hypothetical protein G5V58_12905 [Nocardioides anomalus]